MRARVLDQLGDLPSLEELRPAERIGVVLRVLDGRVGAGRQQRAHDFRMIAEDGQV